MVWGACSSQVHILLPVSRRGERQQQVRQEKLEILTGNAAATRSPFSEKKISI